MKVLYVGNFSVAHSTESHVGQALEANGVTVDRRQENQVDWTSLARDLGDADFVLWTTTNDYAPPRTYGAQRGFLHDCEVPVVSYHLDIWWELSRQHLIYEAPFFRTDLVVTADGGHDEMWKAAGVNHRWMPPGVSEFECGGGTPRDEYRSPVAFVGSWNGSYHREHRHRGELVAWLQRNRDDCTFWPRPGEHAIRNEPLRDLYASVDVFVGDSCFAGRIANYHSDRIPECLGRGGFLLHPVVDGVTDGSLYSDGEHLRTWRTGDWEALRYLLDHYTEHPEEARAIAEKGRAHVLQHHTYTVRMRELLALVATTVPASFA